MLTPSVTNHQKKSNSIIVNDADFLTHELLRQNKLNGNNKHDETIESLNYLKEHCKCFTLHGENAKYFLHILQNRSYQDIVEFFSENKVSIDQVINTVDSEGFYPLNLQDIIENLIDKQRNENERKTLFGAFQLKSWKMIYSHVTYGDYRVVIPSDIKRLFLYTDPSDLKRLLDKFPSITLFNTYYGFKKSQLYTLLTLSKEIFEKEKDGKFEDIFSQVVDHILYYYYQNKEGFDINSRRQKRFTDLYAGKILGKKDVSHREKDGIETNEMVEQDDAFHEVIEKITHAALQEDTGSLTSIENDCKTDLLQTFDVDETTRILGLIEGLTKRHTAIQQMIKKYKGNGVKILQKEYFKKSSSKYDFQGKIEITQMGPTIVCICDNHKDYVYINESIGSSVNGFEFGCAVHKAKRKELYNTLILINTQNIRFARMNSILKKGDEFDNTSIATIMHEIRHHVQQLIMKEIQIVRHERLVRNSKYHMKDEILAQIFGNEQGPLQDIKEEMQQNESYNLIKSAVFNNDNEKIINEQTYTDYVNHIHIDKKKFTAEELSVIQQFYLDIYKQRLHDLNKEYIGSLFDIIERLEKKGIPRKKISNILLRRDISHREDIRDDYTLPSSKFTYDKREDKLYLLAESVNTIADEIQQHTYNNFDEFENGLFALRKIHKPINYK